MKTRTGATYACPLAQARDARRVGGKAYALGRMLALGLPVPPGFVVTRAAFREFLERNALPAPIAALCRGLDARVPDRLREVSRAVRGLVMGARIPEPIRERVAALRGEILPSAALAVRSSAVGEDSDGASFAGQLDSCLDVNSSEELEQAILACWASYWSERSLSYQQSRGVRLDGMGVVIQALVRSRLSGVLFTQAPDASPPGTLVGEYGFGRGDALVSGRINPGRFTIARAGLRWRQEAAPEEPDPAGDRRLLDDAVVSALARTGLALERAFGGPQDIEWAIDGEGRLHVVQSRPVTAARRPAVLWSNANVNENFPGPVSPLLYSIASAGYSHYFRTLARAFGISARRIRAMEPPLRGLIGVHGARMYYNLTNIHAVLSMAPCGDWLAEAFDHFVGAPRTAEPPRPVEHSRGAAAGRIGRLGELLAVALKTTWQYLFLSRRVEAFERAVTGFGERTRPALLERRPLAELLDDFRGFLDIRCHRWRGAALADAAAMVCYGLLKRVLNAAFPAADQAALHNTLLKGLPDIVSSVPIARLWELSRLIRDDAALATLFATTDSREIVARLDDEDRFAPFRRRLDDFLEQWGFRCSGELMLTVPSFQENPAALLEILKRYVGVEGESPLDVQRRQDAERAAETTRVLGALAAEKRLPYLPGLAQAWLVRLLLAWTHRSIAFRERARLKQALLYSRCRRIVLAMGDRLVALGHLDRRDDVFFLTCEELDALVSGAAMFPYHVKALVELRRAAHAELGATAPPDAIVLPEGAYFPRPGAAAPHPGRDDDAGEPAELSGIGACGGRVTARAAVLDDVSESRRLEAGDILVTRQTDPGWGPVFFLIGGLVMERGGMLSHGAILAREYGIPSVVGVREATRRIAPGRTVSVDGDRGRVRLVD